MVSKVGMGSEVEVEFEKEMEKMCRWILWEGQLPRVNSSLARWSPISILHNASRFNYWLESNNLLWAVWAAADGLETTAQTWD